MMTKPNIFRFSTKELTQDGFFTWLLQWADSNNAAYDNSLNALAQEFVRRLLSSQYTLTDLTIEKVRVFQQQDRIDIVAEVNDEYVIVIEDKTQSSEHDDQLERHKRNASAKYQGRKLIFIYLKTGNESLITLKNVREKGYTVVERGDILKLVAGKQIQNEIFVEFREYLTAIEAQTCAFLDLDSVTSDWLAAQGLCKKLQEHNLARHSAEEISDWVHQVGDWGYVPNASGGFLGFWYHWNSTKDCEVNIQIENAFDGGIRLAVKISEWQPSTERLRMTLAQLQPIGQRYGLSLSKPPRFRPGNTSTVALVDNAFQVDRAGKLDFDKLTRVLVALEKTVDEYCEK